MKTDGSDMLLHEDAALQLNPEYFPPHRALVDIEKEIEAAENEHDRLRLQLEHVEADLHHFCLGTYITPISGCYVEKFVNPKRILDQKRIKALHALRAIEIEKGLES